MEYRRTSFLKDIAPDTYTFLSEMRPFAFIYLGVLAIAVLLSLFVQWSIVKFFIDCMMGWTLLSIPFIGVLIVVLDKEINLPQEERWESSPTKSVSYKFSMVWGIFLIVGGLVTLYFSNQYKNYYAFQCQTFYIEQPTGVYHLRDRCEYIGLAEDEVPIEGVSISKVKGIDLLDEDYSLCDACREWAEDAEMDFEANRYYRR